jgi:hypothetical protein
MPLVTLGAFQEECLLVLAMADAFELRFGPGPARRLAEIAALAVAALGRRALAGLVYSACR